MAAAPRGASRVMAALLAFDTSTDRMHLGLSWGSREWIADCPGGVHASANLLPRVLALLSEAGTCLRDLDAIAFGRGPGAFTGLRTACAAAQGLALGARRPVLMIDTLMACAEDGRARTGASDVWVAVDARMGEVYAARFAHAEGGWRTVVAPGLYTPEGLAAIWRREPAGAVTGSAIAAFAGRLDPGSTAAVVADSAPRGVALLACARASLARGESVDAAAALPSYLRDRVALTTAEREALKSAVPTR